MTNKHMKSVVDFDAFLNEPPPYEELRTVREFRYEAYREWLKVCTDIDRLREALKAARDQLEAVQIHCAQLGIIGCAIASAKAIDQIDALGD